MNPIRLPLRNEHRPTGTGCGATVTDESGSPGVLNPSSAEIDLLPESDGDLADSPITPNIVDLAAPDGPLGDTDAFPASDRMYGTLLRGPWKSQTFAPTETLAESVLQHLRGLLVVLDADLRIRLANRAFCDAFQIAPDKIEGRWFPELGTSGRNVPRLRELLNRVLAQDAQRGALEIVHDVLTTRPRTMVIRARRLAESGSGDRLLLEIEDVTERKALERRRRELIVTAVHELRNPLTAIKGYAQLMQRRKRTSEKSIAIILKQTHQLSRLVDDLLASSGPAIAQPCLEPGLMDLVALARASTHQAQLLGPGHLIRLEVPVEPLEGVWDGGRLTQVFANLLGNAVKYSPAGGEIVVRIQDLGPTVRVSIEDKGAGIAADALPRIFDQFYRVAATANHVPGLGLGLHVSKSLVEAHGGSISVRSVPDLGSTFSFELPRVSPAPDARAARLLEAAPQPETAWSTN